MRSIRWVCLAAVLGVYAALAMLPLSDDAKSAQVLAACFSFGHGLAPYAWYLIVLTTWYLPLPLIIVSLVATLVFMRANGLHPHGLFELLAELKYLSGKSPVAAAARMVRFGFWYFLLTAAAWIAYAGYRGV